MSKATEKLKKKPSLGWLLIGIVLACWILPIAIISAVAGYSITNNINRQIEGTITSSVENAVRSSYSRLEGAIAASRTASYNPAVKEAYYSFLETGDRIILYDRFKSFLSQQYQYDEKFLTTILFRIDDPDSIYYTLNTAYGARYLDVIRYYEEVHAEVKEISKGLDTDIRFLSKDGAVYMIRNLVDSNDAFRPFAVLVMEMNTQVMFEGIQNIIWQRTSEVWLDETRIPLTADGLTLTEHEKSMLRDRSSALYEREDDYVAYGCMKVQNTEFAYTVSVDKLSLLAELAGFRTMFLWVIVLVVPLLAIAVVFFYINVSRPVDRLLDGTRHVEQGGLGYQIETRYSNREFQYLTESFNKMSERLKYQFERIYNEELALRDAKIMALQSQINPHFLNNTLELINWEARLADNIKVSRMIEALSTMLDAAMDRKGKQLVRLSEEMMYVDAYLYIISERLGKRLKVCKEIDEELLSCEVPRLVMQPILENAVEHGVQRRQQGVVTIRAYRQAENAIVLEVENEGEMTWEDQQHIARLLAPGYDGGNENSGNLGIYNVNQRVRMIFGEGSGLFIETTRQGGTAARIVIAKKGSERAAQP